MVWKCNGGPAPADLEAVFADPDCFHSPGSCDPRPVQDYAISLASEFVGEYHDDLIPARLARLTEAEDVGSSKAARRHLTFVRRKVASRLREWWGHIAANAQVAETHAFRRSRRNGDVADGCQNPSCGPGTRRGLVLRTQPIFSQECHLPTTQRASSGFRVAMAFGEVTRSQPE